MLLQGSSQPGDGVLVSCVSVSAEGFCTTLPPGRRRRWVGGRAVNVSLPVRAGPRGRGRAAALTALWVRCPPMVPRGWRSRRQTGCVVGTRASAPGNLLWGHRAPRHPQGGLRPRCRRREAAWWSASAGRDCCGVPVSSMWTCARGPSGAFSLDVDGV